MKLLSETVVIVLVDAVVEELAGEGEEEVEGDEDEEEHREEHPRLHVDPQGDLLRFWGRKMTLRLRKVLHQIHQISR